jgi:hypothetical protein
LADVDAATVAGGATGSEQLREEMTMIRFALACALLGFLSQPFTASAQSLAPGKYTGTFYYLWMGKPMQDMVTLTIETVEGNQFQGTAWLGNKLCRVDTPVKGRLDGETLTVTGKAVKEGCGIRWELKAEGTKFEGKTSGGNTITLSK